MYRIDKTEKENEALMNNIREIAAKYGGFDRDWAEVDENDRQNMNLECTLLGRSIPVIKQQLETNQHTDATKIAYLAWKQSILERKPEQNIDYVKSIENITERAKELIPTISIGEWE